MTTRRFIGWGLGGLLAAGLVYWVAISPDNPVTRLFQRSISDVDAAVVVGPYPTERDFRLLQSHGVGLVVSLLNEHLPYEKVLLERERRFAGHYGMKFLNYPMTSIVGYPVGESYTGNAERAAEAIRAANTKVYLHCYLGLHRTKTVRALLAARGVVSGTYTQRQVEREQPRMMLDAAEISFRDGRYEEALAELRQIAEDRRTRDARLLQAWCHFRLGQVDEAATIFDAVLQTASDDVAAMVGAGYCALRRDPPAAERRFARALELAPDNAEALGGRGLAAYRAGRNAEAARYLDAALRLTPENQELREVRERIRAAPPPGP